MGSDSWTVTMLRTYLSLILILGVALTAGASGQDVENLLGYMFRQYNKDVLPLDTDGPVNVEIGVSLINMNLASQVMSATAWVRMRWTENPDLPESLAGIYSRYRAGDNM